MNGSIHGLPDYLIFSPSLKFSTLQAFIPLVYIIPTIFVMIKILMDYSKAKTALKAATMDHNIFVLIMFYFLFNMLFFVGDYLHLNLPSSGLITSFYAKFQPSKVFTIILIYAYASNFGVIICPFLVCLIRLAIFIFPRDNERYCRLIMRRFANPFLFLTPLALTLWNIPVTVYCKQLGEPFSFGAIYLYEGDDYAQLNILVHFCFSCVIFCLTASMSIVMFYKLRKTVRMADSSSERTKALTRRAEMSLSLTMVSCFVPFITNSICSVTFLLNRPNYYYVLFLRPIGNDYETVMMPWVLFLTHPMFRPRKLSVTGSSSTVWRTTSTRTSAMV